jgi:PKD repeat protein
MRRRSHCPNPKSHRSRWNVIALLVLFCLSWMSAEAEASISGAGFESPSGTLVFSPSSGVFGSVAVGATSPVMTFTATNNTTSTMGYLGYSNLGEFYLQPGTCHLVNNEPMLAPGKSCSFTAVFKPSKPGPMTGQLSIQTSSGTFVVPMSGTGAALAIVPTNPNFGSLAVGKTSTIRSFTVTNYTTAAATYVGQVGSAAFKVLPGTCRLAAGGPMVAAGASCVFTVQFVPAVVGVATGSLNISTNAGPFVFTMYGIGTGSAPVANAGGPYKGTTGHAVSFQGSASTAPSGQTITGYAWNFGDGTSGSGVSPTHTYASAGTYNVSLTVTDTAGLTGTAATTAQIVAPPNPLSIKAVVSPAPNGAGWNNTPVTVSFICATTGSPIVSCPAPQTISSEVLGEVVSGTVTDVAGDKATASATVNLETKPPAVTISSPANNATISLATTSIGVSGSVSSDVASIASVTCGGAAAVVSGPSFTCTAALKAGINKIAVVATDIAGNTSTAPLSLTFVQAPSIQIVSPANLGVTNLTPVTINGTVSDPNATVKVDGVSVPQSGGAFSSAVPLVEGLNVLTAVATNAAGISSTATIEVTLDTTPPHVAINSPANGSVFTAASVTVTGLANDVVVGTVNLQDLAVTVNGIAAQVANRSFSALNVPLAVGPNTIQATGTDRAGNSTTTSVEVTRVLASQPPAPAIGKAVLTQWVNIVSGNNQSGVAGTALAAPIVVSLTDSASHPLANQTVVFKVTQNNGLVATAGGTPASAVTVTTDMNGSAHVAWTLGKRAGAGNNTLQVSSALAVSPVTFTATGTTGSATQIVVDSGNNQTGVLGQPLPFPFVVDVVDAGHNRVPGVPVVFSVKQGGGSFAGAPTATVTSDSNGRAIIILTEGLQTGNDVVEATFAGNPGLPAAFVAVAKAPGNPSATTISGVVLDNSNQPIQNVTIRLYMQYQGQGNNLPVQVGTPVVTNAQGTFLIAPAPVGSYKLMADGSTAAGAISYPTLEYDIVTVAGNDNTVGMPIYLPALDTVDKVCVDETHGGILTLPQYPGFALNIAAGSATFPGGARSGCVSATPVNGDKVPMAPGFGQQPRFIVTIQPVGTIFNPPAPMTLPNVDGLAPKTVTEMYSYDHDLAMFVAIGTGTVSGDGSVIQSDPGVGVVKAGWHCGGDPNQTGAAGTCPTCQTCTGDSCATDPAQDMKACTTATVPSGVCTAGQCQPLTVQVTAADVTMDTIAVTLSGAPAGTSGNLTIQLTGATNSQVYQGSVGNGSANYSFNLSTLPALEYTGITATWVVSGVTVTGTYNYHIRVLGQTRLTVYNTPAESQCSGAPQADTVFNNACTVTNANLVSGFIFRVTNPAGGTGSGISNNFGSVYQEAFCPGHSSTSLRSFQTITGRLGGLSDSTLAACPTGPDYVAGAQIYINGSGVKTVTDRCPACCNDLPHFDNYSTSRQCSGLPSLPSAITVRIY